MISGFCYIIRYCATVNSDNIRHCAKVNDCRTFHIIKHCLFVRYWCHLLHHKALCCYVRFLDFATSVSTVPPYIITGSGYYFIVRIVLPCKLLGFSSLSAILLYYDTKSCCAYFSYWILVVVVFSSLAMILGECSAIRSPPALFCCCCFFSGDKLANTNSTLYARVI